MSNHWEKTLWTAYDKDKINNDILSNTRWRMRSIERGQRADTSVIVFSDDESHIDIEVHDWILASSAVRMFEVMLGISSRGCFITPGQMIASYNHDMTLVRHWNDAFQQREINEYTLFVGSMLIARTFKPCGEVFDLLMPSGRLTQILYEDGLRFTWV